MGAFELQQKQFVDRHGAVDRSQDLRILLDYYTWYREANEIESLEEAAQVRRLGASTDLMPDRCIYVLFFDLTHAL